MKMKIIVTESQLDQFIHNLISQEDFSHKEYNRELLIKNFKKDYGVVTTSGGNKPVGVLRVVR